MRSAQTGVFCKLKTNPSWQNARKRIKTIANKIKSQKATQIHHIKKNLCNHKLEHSAKSKASS